MYIRENVCTSACTDCGVLCEPFPVTDLESARFYSSQRCTTILGDLHLYSLPTTLTYAVLLLHLGLIEEIRGALIFRHNEYLPRITFLKKLHHVEGIEIVDMPVLADAQIPSLKYIGRGTHIEGCFRLCPARYPSLQYTSDDTDCPSFLYEFYSFLSGSVHEEQLFVFNSLISQMVFQLTGEAVS
jgi:hypothetical protein